MPVCSGRRRLPKRARYQSIHAHEKVQGMGTWILVVFAATVQVDGSRTISAMQAIPGWATKEACEEAGAKLSTYTERYYKPKIGYDCLKSSTPN